MSTFANQIDQELPDACILICSNAIAKYFNFTTGNKKLFVPSIDQKTPTIELLLDNLSLSGNSNDV